MLVLERQKDEEIVVLLRAFAEQLLAGEIALKDVRDIRIMAVRQTCERMWLGFEAPRGLAIHRSEVLERIRAAEAKGAV